MQHNEKIINSADYDAIIIGAGLGGLLTAAQLLTRGQRVAIVERLHHVGGRFTAKPFQGAQISTGAVHMLPFGSNGIVAAMLRELHIPHYVHDAEVFGSFHIRGQQIRARSILALARVFAPKDFARLVSIGRDMMLRSPRPDELNMTYAQWLTAQGITKATHPDIVVFFERVSHFTLSVDLDQVSYLEVCETLKNMFRYGPPGIVDGGCGAIAQALEERVRTAGATVFLNHDVRQILQQDGRATGIIARDKQTGLFTSLTAPLIISNIGPYATDTLLQPATQPSTATTHDHQGATGLKTHLLLEQSFVPHKGILYCLDTERIAGIVQPSNSDPSLAPPGKHLLITHQLWRTERESIAEARALAMRDLEYLLGPQDNGQWRVLTMSQYHDAWPVNRAKQGEDATPTTAVNGVYLVGDAIKPSGYLMVEGVAQSVNELLDILESHPATDSIAPLHNHVAAKPSRRRALNWLIAPPAPYKQIPVESGSSQAK